eukprot:jgi/Chrzof1/5073/Cz15g10230.t1
MCGSLTSLLLSQTDLSGYYTPSAQTHLTSLKSRHPSTGDCNTGAQSANNQQPRQGPICKEPGRVTSSSLPAHQKQNQQQQEQQQQHCRPQHHNRASYDQHIPLQTSAWQQQHGDQVLGSSCHQSDGYPSTGQHHGPQQHQDRQQFQQQDHHHMQHHYQHHQQPLQQQQPPMHPQAQSRMHTPQQQQQQQQGQQCQQLAADKFQQQPGRHGCHQPTVQQSRRQHVLADERQHTHQPIVHNRTQLNQHQQQPQQHFHPPVARQWQQHHQPGQGPLRSNLPQSNAVSCNTTTPQHYNRYATFDAQVDLDDVPLRHRLQAKASGQPENPAQSAARMASQDRLALNKQQHPAANPSTTLHLPLDQSTSLTY